MIYHSKKDGLKDGFNPECEVFDEYPSDYKNILLKAIKRHRHMGVTDYEGVIYSQEKEIDFYRKKIFELEKRLKMEEYKSKEKSSTWISIYTNQGRCDLTVNVPIEDMKKNISGVLENSEKFFRATDYKGNTYIFPIDSIDHIELYQVQKREV